jgi:hypothetical protein
MITRIAHQSEGNARRCLQILETALACKTEKDQKIAVNMVSNSEEEKIDFLAKTIMQGANWSSILKIIDKIEEKDLETIRRQVLAYCTKVLGSPGGHSKNYQIAFQTIQEFRDPWQSCGKAGLLAACYTINLTAKRITK